MRNREVSPGVRRLLHCAVDLIADSRDAGGKAGRGAVCQSGLRIALPSFRVSGAPGGLFFPVPVRGDVRHLPGRGAAIPRTAGTRDCPSGRVRGFSPLILF